jgi:tryptophan-rich sensory protein
LVILGTVHRFRRLHRVAVWCPVPLVAWVAFASALNFEIWRLNG